MPTHAAQLASFGSSLTLADIPADVRETAKLRILDALGCGHAAVAADACAPAVAWGADPAAGGAAGPAGEALTLGTLCHALDYDDTHPEALCHISAVVAPAALALARATGADGAAVLTACVAGNEALARLGCAAPGPLPRARHPSHRRLRRVRRHARLRAPARPRRRRHDARPRDRREHVERPVRVPRRRRQTKPFHAGWAAHAGIMAAQLAAHGLAGPATVLEGRFGLYRALLGEDHGEDLSRELGDLWERWETLRIAIKPFPTCHLTHAGMQAACELRSRGVTAADAEEITLAVPESAPGIVLEPREAKLRPRSPYDAKFSLPWTVAAMLVDGEVGVSTFARERLGDPAILDLAARIGHVVETRGPDAPFFSRLDARLTDGSTVSIDVDHPLGTPQQPLDRHAILAKFAANTAGTGVDPDELAAPVLDLESLADVRGVVLPGALTAAV